MGLQETLPVKLGSTGTFILTTMFLVSAALNVYQVWKRKTVESLQTALSASETERKIHEEASKRKSAELAEAHQTIGELKAKTDLSAVLTMLSETITLTRESVDLSRKFDRDNAQLNSNIVRALEKHGESDIQIFGSIDTSLKETAQTLHELKVEIQDHRKKAGEMIDSVLDAIREGHETRG